MLFWREFHTFFFRREIQKSFLHTVLNLMKQTSLFQIFFMTLLQCTIKCHEISFFGKEKIIQKVSIVLLLCRYFKRDGAKYKCLYQMWRCTVFFSAGNSNSSLFRKFKKCQLLLCRLTTQSQIQMFSSDVTGCTVFWRDFHNQLFLAGNLNSSLWIQKVSIVLKLLCRYYTEPNTNVFIRCDSAQWEIFGKRQNCRRWIRFFGQIWDEAHWEIIEDSGHDWLTWHSVCTVGFPPSWQLPFDEIFLTWHLCELNHQQFNAVLG